MSNDYPNLLDMTCVDDTMRVYILNIGVSFDSLSNEEKKIAYNSQQYLANKFCKKWQDEIAKNRGVESKYELPDQFNPFVIGFSKDEYDVDIVGYEEDFKEWHDKEGKTHNVTHWKPLPNVPDLEDEDWEEEE